jgi:hypothetical protein
MNQRRRSLWLNGRKVMNVKEEMGTLEGQGTSTTPKKTSTPQKEKTIKEIEEDPFWGQFLKKEAKPQKEKTPIMKKYIQLITFLNEILNNNKKIFTDVAEKIKDLEKEVKIFEKDNGYNYFKTSDYGKKKETIKQKKGMFKKLNDDIYKDVSGNITLNSDAIKKEFKYKNNKNEDKYVFYKLQNPNFKKEMDEQIKNIENEMKQVGRNISYYSDENKNNKDKLKEI